MVRMVDFCSEKVPSTGMTQYTSTPGFSPGGWESGVVKDEKEGVWCVVCGVW